MEGKNACSSTFDSSGNNGWGPIFQNACLHSGSNEYSSGDTVWYGYVLASAGTIIDENTTEENPANNSTTATESICPKGWTLPSKTQVNAIGNNTTTYIPSFSPVLGGYYGTNAVKVGTSLYGNWWSSEASGSGLKRRILQYNNTASTGVLGSTNYNRQNGLYIRCVPKS